MRKLFLLLILSGCFLASCSTPDSKALKSFKAGNYDNADTLLSAERLAIPQGRYTLEKAYILRASDHLATSTGHLERALELLSPGISAKDSLRQEIYLNLFLNAYLSNDNKDLNNLFEKSKDFFDKKDPWLRLFQGLEAYQQSRYAEASNFWKDLTPPDYLSPWMEAAFSKLLPTSIFVQEQARAAIFSGDAQSIRRNLIKELQNPENREQTLFLLALTYIQGAENKDPVEALPDLRLAYGYLLQVPDVKARYPLEISHFNSLILKDIEILLSTKTYNALPLYVNVIQEWGTKEQLAQLDQIIVAQSAILIKKGQIQELKKLVRVINDLLKDPSTRDDLAQHYENQVVDSLHQDDLTTVKQLVHLEFLFSAKPDVLEHHTAGKIESELSNLLNTPQPSSKKALDLVEIWKSLERSHLAWFQYSQILLNSAKTAWSIKGHESSALLRMQLAWVLSPPNRQKDTKRNMQKLISIVYSSAIVQSDFNKLKYFLEAQQLFDLDSSFLKSPQEMANLQADANLLFKQGNYNQAFLVAQWIVHLQPDSQAAIKLAALSAYQLGNYVKALPFLKQLSSDPQFVIPLAISEVAAGDAAQGKKLIDQEAQTNALPTEVYERLAIAALNKGDGNEALNWLSQSLHLTDEMSTISLLASYLIHDDKQVLEKHSKLPEFYGELEPVISATAISAIRLGKDDVAEGLFEDLYLYGKMLNPTRHTFTPFFQLINTPELAPPKNFAGAMYYEKVLHNPEKALEQLTKSPLPFLEAALLQAEVLMHLHRDEDALKILLAYQAKLDKSINKDTLKLTFWPLLAEVQAKRGAWIEASDAWQNYFKLQKEPPYPSDYLRELAIVWSKLQRYDLAEQEWNKIPNDKLLPEDQLDIINGKFHLSNFKAVDTLSTEFLKKYPTQTDLRLKLAQILALTKNTALYQDAIKDLPPLESLDNSSSKAYFQLALINADFPLAQQLFDARSSLWKDDPTFTPTLYQYYTNLSKPDLAQTAARQGAQLFPNQLDAALFAIQHGNDDAYNAAWITKLHPDYDIDQLSATELLIYGLALQEEALEDFLSGRAPSVEHIPALYQSAQALEKLAQHYSHIPEALYYYGQTLYLLGKKENALEKFQSAIRIDDSYSEAYLNAGLASGTISYINKALQWAPNNPQAWEVLAMIELKQENLQEAIKAYHQASIFKPYDPTLYFKIGELQLQANNPKQAVEAFDQALAITPNEVEILQELLKALYHPYFLTQKETLPNITAQQQEVYEKLYQLNPKEAVQLRKKLISHWKP